MSKLEARVGIRMPRVDAPETVAGEAQYTDDIFLPGMLYGAIATSPIAHGRIVSIDTSSRTDDVKDLREGTGRQLEWLEDVLSEAAADTTVDWIVTFQHHPAYSHAVGISGHGLDRAVRFRAGRDPAAASDRRCGAADPARPSLRA